LTYHRSSNCILVCLFFHSKAFATLGVFAAAIGDAVPPHPPTQVLNRHRLFLIEEYTDLVKELDVGNNALDLLVPHVTTMLQFLGSCLSTPEFCHDDNCLRKALALLGYSAQQLGHNKQILLKISKPFFNEQLHNAILSSNEATRGCAKRTRALVWNAFDKTFPDEN
jgi:hypothetical protein